MESFHTKPDSPSARDESKEAILNLPLIPIIKIKAEIRQRTKVKDGERQKLKEYFRVFINLFII